jgi:hypothetical protein
MVLRSSSRGYWNAKVTGKGNVKFLQRLMTYGHCFPLYLGTEIPRALEMFLASAAHTEAGCIGAESLLVVHRDM